MTERLMTRTEAAMAVGVSYSAIKAWELRGDLRPVGMTGLANVRLFRRADVERVARAKATRKIEVAK
jgi:DNA-binding transcriptional MerR regulator